MTKLFDSVEAALAEIDRVPEGERALRIGLASSMTFNGQVVRGDIAMAIILDKLLSKDFMPDGFEEVAGGRVYRYAR